MVYFHILSISSHLDQSLYNEVGESHLFGFTWQLCLFWKISFSIMSIAPSAAPWVETSFSRPDETSTCKVGPIFGSWEFGMQTYAKICKQGLKNPSCWQVSYFQRIDELWTSPFSSRNHRLPGSASSKSPLLLGNPWDAIGIFITGVILMPSRYQKWDSKWGWPSKLEFLLNSHLATR